MKTILFIEDEAALQKTFEDALGKEGYNVVHALEGEAGLRLAKEERPDIILLDLILPRLNGLEVLEALKSDQTTRNIPVIVLTNREEMEDIQNALNLGATSYLVKSNYKLEEVVAKVKQMFE